MARTTPSEFLIGQRLAVVRRMLPGARRGDVHAIHQTRVATRRLREAIPVVVGQGGAGRKLRRSVRRLTRALGPVRELDVALLTLEELGAAGEAPRRAIVCLRQSIADERRRLHAELVRRIDRSDLDKLQRKALAAARGKRPTVRDDRRIAAARARTARRAERLRAAIDNAAGMYLPDRLHEVRIEVKKLRYALEVSRELTRSRATARIDALKRMQDLLGRMHDLEVLIARTRALQGSPGAPDLRVSGALDALVRRLETECRQLHGQYIGSRRALLKISDAVIAAEPKGSHADAA
jgi:CHAD domain-containing protein